MSWSPDRLYKYSYKNHAALHCLCTLTPKDGTICSQINKCNIEGKRNPINMEIRFDYTLESLSYMEI